MRFVGLVKHELARLLVRRRLYLLTIGMALVGVSGIVGDSQGLVSSTAGTISPTAPMLLFGMLDQLAFLFILWPVAVGGTLAEDVGSDLKSLLVTRAGSRIAWLGSKVVAAFLTSAVAFVALAATWGATALIISPWRLAGLSGVVTFGGGVAERHPLLLIGFVLVVLALAATCVATVSSAIGAATGSPASSQVGASIVYLVCIFIAPRQFNPLSRASMLSFSAPWMTPASVVWYWSTALVLLVAATYAVVRWNEAR